MKLGLVINITSGGLSEAYSVNKSADWSRYVYDVRTAINTTLVGFDGSGKSVILAKFLGKSGYLLCVIKARSQGSGRGGDNVAAWVYIPGNCDIANLEIIDLLGKVETAVSSIKIDTASLDALFRREYKEKSVLISAISKVLSNSDKKFALRYYNDGKTTIDKLLGAAIAQQEYSSYEGIFFVDKTAGITTNGDVLNFAPKEICTLHPLSSIDGFAPCFHLQGKYVSFSKAIEVSVGSQISIHWCKEGYAVIKKTFIVQNSSECPETVKITPNEYKVIVKREHFRVCTSNNAPINISNAQIVIDGKHFTGKTMEVSEYAYRNGVSLSINAKGYEEYKDNNYNLSEKKKITMQRHIYHYEFEIPYEVDKDSFERTTFSIDTHHKITRCPIEGYTTYDEYISEGSRRPNRLEPKSSLKLKIMYFVYGALFAFLMLFLYAGWTALDNYEFKWGWPPFREIRQHNNPVNDVQEQEMDALLKEQDSIDTAIAIAIAYMEANDIWHKDSLERYDATKGLFDELNTFNFESLKNRNERLNKPSKLDKIVEKMGKQNGKKTNSSNYNNPDDFEITVSKYMKYFETSTGNNAGSAYRNAQPENNNNFQLRKGNEGDESETGGDQSSSTSQK